MIQYIFPKKIVKSRLFSDVKNLLCRQSLQIGLSETTTATVKNDGYIILDYGKEMNGSIRILTFKANNTKISILFGESLTECSSELGG